jgi:hypothetical protein
VTDIPADNVTQSEV